MRSAAHVADAAETRLNDASRRFVNVVDEVSADIGNDARRGCASADDAAPEAANPPLQGFAGQDFMVCRRCEEGSGSQGLPPCGGCLSFAVLLPYTTLLLQGISPLRRQKGGLSVRPLTPSVVTFPSQTSRSAHRSGR